jgi:hypothetical protein
MNIVLPEEMWYFLSVGRLSVKVGFAGQELLGGTSGRIMTSPDDVEYKSTITDEHWRNEEFQWARILCEGNPAKGMVLLYIQKACTAFHEFEPAWKAGAVKPDQVDFFRRRLATRIKHVLVTMENNGLDKIEGAAEWAGLLRSAESARTASDLAELTERVHAVNHMLLDSLEGR